MNATGLRRLRVNGRDTAGAGTRPCAPARPPLAPYKRWFYGPRRRLDPREARPEDSQFCGTGWIAQLVHRLGLTPGHHSGRTGCRRRRSGDPMLVFNMLVFNSAKVRECIFDSLPQQENVWL
jgi:hypothetical protein